MSGGWLLYSLGVLTMLAAAWEEDAEGRRVMPPAASALAALAWPFLAFVLICFVAWKRGRNG